MPAIIQCNCCGRITTARIIENDYSTNSLVLEDDIDWNDHDYEYGITVIDGRTYTFMMDDADCKLFESFCQHEEYEILELEDDYDGD